MDGQQEGEPGARVRPFPFCFDRISFGGAQRTTDEPGDGALRLRRGGGAGVEGGEAGGGAAGSKRAHAGAGSGAPTAVTRPSAWSRTPPGPTTKPPGEEGGDPLDRRAGPLRLGEGGGDGGLGGRDDGDAVAKAFGILDDAERVARSLFAESYRLMDQRRDPDRWRDGRRFPRTSPRWSPGRGYVAWDVDHAGWVVDLMSPDREQFHGRTLEEALVRCVEWLMTNGLGIGAFA